MSLAQRVVTARKKKGLTQEELAELTNITVRTIQRIESGETTPRPYTVKAIAAALDTTFEELNASESGSLPSFAAPKLGSIHKNEREDAAHFLQLLCLSCFSYLVLPFIHFLVPIYILKRRKEQNPAALAYARKMIRIQVYWVISL